VTDATQRAEGPTYPTHFDLRDPTGPEARPNPPDPPDPCDLPTDLLDPPPVPSPPEDGATHGATVFLTNSAGRAWHTA